MGVEVSCAKDLKQLCLTKAKIMQLPIEALITGEGIESAEVSKMSEFRVVTALSNGKPTKKPGVVECRLHSLAKGFHHQMYCRSHSRWGISCSVHAHCSRTS